MCYSAMVEQDIKILESRFGATIVRQSWDLFESHRLAGIIKSPGLPERIYPGYSAPVLAYEDNRLVARLMRYSASPPDFIPENRRLTTFNARRDNLLSPFWSECFRKNHGFIVLRGFFEWVAVRDLIKAGRVSIDQVKAEFERQKNQRMERLLQEHKPARPTKAEQTEALFRKTVIEFHPDGMSELLVPVIFSKKNLPNGETDFGFAIVTDDPPPEVRQAGHDRCPVFLDRQSVEQWAKGSRELSPESLDRLLAKRLNCSFGHRLAAA